MSNLRYYLKKTLFLLDYLIWFLFSPFKFKRLNSSKNRKVLVINQGFIGDLLVTTPLIKGLSDKFGKVDILVRKEMADLLKGNPNLDKIIIFDDYSSLLREIKNKYGYAIVIWPRSLKLILTLMGAKIPIRIGYAQTDISLSSLFLTRSLYPLIHSHKVEQNLASGKLLGIKNKNPSLEIYVSEKEKVRPKKFMAMSQHYAVIHPGKRTSAGKQYLWSAKGFADVADFLIEKKKMSVFIGGSDADNVLAKEIISLTKNKVKVIDTTGKLNVKEYAHLISGAEIVVSIDTSAVHLAASYNRKIVCLFNSYPEVWHPWEDKKNYSLLLNQNVKDIDSDKVKREIIKLLR